MIVLTSEAVAAGELLREASSPRAHAPPRAQPRKRAPGPGRRGILGFAVPVALLVVWEGLGRTGLAAPNLLPTPTAVLDTLGGLVLSGELFGHILVTFARVAAGFALGTAAATALGALTGYSAFYRLLLDPLIQGLRSVPSLAWVPLFVLWLGIFETSKIALVAAGVFFPVYLNLMSGIHGVDRKLVEVGRMYGLRGLGLVRRVLVPATLPAYIVGLRSGLGLGWMFVLAAEFMGASEGLGYLLIDGQMTGRPAAIIGGVILFAVFGKLTDALLARGTRPFLAWQDSFAARREREDA